MSREFPLERQKYREFHGGPVVRTPSFHCREHGFYSWGGRGEEGSGGWGAVGSRVKTPSWAAQPKKKKKKKTEV